MLASNLEPPPGLEPRTPDYKSGALPITLMAALRSVPRIRRLNIDGHGITTIIILDDANIPLAVAIVIIDRRRGRGGCDLNVGAAVLAATTQSSGEEKRECKSDNSFSHVSLTF